jgi:hypothetical protein
MGHVSLKCSASQLAAEQSSGYACLLFPGKGATGLHALGDTMPRWKLTQKGESHDNEHTVVSAEIRTPL